MFGNEFYPTPENVVCTMLEGINIENKIFLEPSAGKGNIIDHLKKKGAKTVLSYEINKDLQIITGMKSRLLGSDFFECRPEDISHINYIVMNPPFSNAIDHILHAWEVAPEGCEILSLLNWANIDKWDYNNDEKSFKKRRLKQTVETYGNIFYLDSCFKEAERKTGVEVALIHLFKPIVSEDFDYEGFYLEDEPEHAGSIGVMKYNEITEIVGRYIGAVKCFSSFEVVNNQMNDIIKPIGFGRGFTYSIGHNNDIVEKADFVKQLQKRCWQWVFDKLHLHKYVTNGVMQDINKFVETQTKYPFTVKNVYRMLEIIVGTYEHNMKRALIDAVDYYTRHTHENRFAVEGWKTNAGHLLNKKFIIPYIVRYSYGNLEATYSSSYLDKLDDLIKILCYLTGVELNSIKPLRMFLNDSKCQPNKWYNWGFFEIKGFKKGTLHLKFREEKVWEMLNRKYAEIKGQVLPEKI